MSILLLTTRSSLFEINTICQGFFYYIKQRNQCIFHSEPVSFFKTWFDARNKKLSSTESPMLFRVNLITKKNMYTSEEKIINL